MTVKRCEKGFSFRCGNFYSLWMEIFAPDKKDSYDREKHFYGRLRIRWKKSWQFFSPTPDVMSSLLSRKQKSFSFFLAWEQKNLINSWKSTRWESWHDRDNTACTMYPIHRSAESSKDEQWVEKSETMSFSFFQIIKFSSVKKTWTVMENSKSFFSFFSQLPSKKTFSSSTSELFPSFNDFPDVL